MAIDLPLALQTFTAVSAGIVALFSAPPLLAWRQKLGIDTLQTVSHIASQVVAAIEQRNGAGPGPTKKALALNILEEILAARGLVVPDSFLDAAIEAAVLALKPRTAPSPQTIALPATLPPGSFTVTSSSIGSTALASAAEAPGQMSVPQPGQGTPGAML